MYCPDCGKESKPGANFCRYCGSRLPAIPPRNAAEEDQPQTIPKKQTSTRHTAYFLLGMIALCAVSVLAIVLASMQKKPEYRLQVREKSAQASSEQEVPAPAAETPASEASCAFEPSLEDETDKELRDQLIADDAAFFDAEMATRILGFNKLLQEQCHAFFAWKTVKQLDHQTIEAIAQDAFDAAALGKRDMLCAFVPSTKDWYVQCGADIIVDDALRELVSSGMDYIFSERSADAVQRLYQTLRAWYGTSEPSAEQTVSTEDLLPDGFYIMDIYRTQLVPAEEGVYAEGDIYQYVTLPKGTLEYARVGERFDLSRFDAGIGYIQSIDANGGVLVASVDEPSEENAYGGFYFYFREDQNQWVGLHTYSDGFATYKTGYGKALFTPDTQILDYLSMQDPLNGEPVQHADIRDFFTYFSWTREHEKVDLTISGGVVTKAVINYHE